jgi:hypothetical protein
MASASSSGIESTVGVVGTGLVGSRVALQLASAGVRPAIVSRENAAELKGCGVVVLTHGAPHADVVEALMNEGVGVVSTSDDLADAMALLDAGTSAIDRGVAVVAGAAASPGLTGLLVEHVSHAFDVVDEVHVAVHGTGGPACARQHHRALGNVSVGWHDVEWLLRPGGSGRELCWFPDPIGARDCYRFASPEPVMMQRAIPDLARITCRVSATRRDRLTSRLPMLAPPHPEGGVGGVRVEVRGQRDNRRHVEIVGVAEKLASLAGSVAAQSALAMLRGLVAPGVHVLGENTMPNRGILDGVLAAGVVLHQFVGR